MTEGAERQAKALFVEALELDTEARDGFLAERCEANPALRARVQQLLAAHDEAGSFLATASETTGDGASDAAVGRRTLWNAIRGALVEDADTGLSPGDELTAFRLDAELGSGGMGTVYRAECTRPTAGIEAGTRVALKVVHSHLMETEGFFKRFLQEAQVGREIEHPNVVRTLDCDAVARDGKQHHFLVMEHVEGQTLRELLDDVRRVPEELCRRIGREVALGLAAIHSAGAVHRDVKPENLLITQDHVVKVMDLGVAQLQDEVRRLSQDGRFAGSIEYAAPEQFETKRDATDRRTDLYALGVVLYELATGMHPHRADDARRVMRKILDGTPRPVGDVNPQLSPFYEALVHTLLEQEPDARFGSADALADALADGEEGTWWRAHARRVRAETRRPLRRMRIPRETRLCGRAAELGRLRELFEATSKGAGRVVLIEGEAGIGKTRLVDEFVAGLRVDGSDVDFLFGAHAPGGGSTSAEAFVEAYAAHFGGEDASAYLEQAPLLAPAFDALLRGQPAPDRAVALTHDSLGTCFIHATRTLAAERPLVVLIDDLHFASEDSRSLFAQLAAAVPSHPVLLIGTLRPGVPASWIAGLTRLDHTSHIPLGRLGPKDLTRLLVDAFQSERLAEELGFRIAHKSDGNPFFAFEIIRGLREGQLIRRKPDGTWFRTSVIEEIQVPSTVTDLIQARLGDLSDEERELLDVASCIGFRFDPELVSAALDLDPIPALRILGRIENRHRLVRSAGQELVFDHHQVQESLYDRLLEPLRVRYHAAIAEALQAMKPEATIDGGRAVALCLHSLAGGLGDRALAHLPAALAHLRAHARSAQAVDLLDTALAAPGLLDGAARLDALLEKNRLLETQGARAEQQPVLAEAAACVTTDDASAQLRIERERAALALATGNYAVAQERFERCLALARDTEDGSAEAEATGNLGAVAFFQGRYEEAQSLAKHHLAAARTLGDVPGQIRSERFVIAALTRLGRHTEGDAHIRHILEQVEAYDDPTLEIQALGAVSFALLARGHRQEAHPHVERGLELSRAIGYRPGEVVATGNLGMVLWGMGRLEEAQEQLEAWARLAAETGDRTGEAAAHGNLVQVLLEQGHVEDAHASVERQRSFDREIGDRAAQARAMGNLGDVLQMQGRYDEARAAIEEQLAIAREIGDPKQQSNALYRLGLMATDEGALDRAGQQHEQALELRRGLRDAFVADSLSGLARVALARRNRDEAQMLLDEALAVANEHERPRSILVALALRASLAPERTAELVDALDAYEDRADLSTKLEVRLRLWELTGEAAHLEEAHRLLSFALAHAAPEHRPGMLASVPVHAAIQAAWEERST